MKYIYYLSVKVTSLILVLCIYNILHSMDSQLYRILLRMESQDDYIAEEKRRTHFHLENQKLGNGFICSFANKILKDNSAVESLSLNNNNIGDTGLEALIDVLPSMRYITRIDLDTNNITNVGAAALATYLLSYAANNSKSMTIDMRNNPITEPGIQAIADVWEKKRGCRVLFPWKPLLKGKVECASTYLTSTQETLIQRLELIRKLNK